RDRAARGFTTNRRLALTDFVHCRSFDALLRTPQFGQLAELARTLATLSKNNRQFDEPLSFDLAVGNYYQVRSWLGPDGVDGAVVSPTLAVLAMKRGFVPLLELPPRDASASWPEIAAERGGRCLQAPLGEYRAFLTATLRRARGEPVAPGESRYRLQMV